MVCSVDPLLSRGSRAKHKTLCEPGEVLGGLTRCITCMTIGCRSDQVLLPLESLVIYRHCYRTTWSLSTKFQGDFGRLRRFNRHSELHSRLRRFRNNTLCFCQTAVKVFLVSL